MSLDPKSLTSAALRTMPDFEAELTFNVEAMIATKDIGKLAGLMPRLAAINPSLLATLKSKLREGFGKRFSTRDFEASLRYERSRLRSNKPAAQSLPVIQANARPMRDIVREAMDALQSANNPPQLFIRSGKLVYVGIDERQRPAIVDVSADHLRGRLDRAANFILRRESGDVAAPPPMDIVRDILALPAVEWPFPALEVVVEVPTLRPDGTVLSEPGYDAASRMLYQPAPGLDMAPVPENPSPEEINLAVGLIVEALGDFPFLAEAEDGPNASWANTFALLLTPIIRPAIGGCTPLALIDAPQAGTGKSLLVDTFSVITTVRAASMMPYPRSEEEMQKALTSTLLAGRSIICFDNVESAFASPTLALVLTAKEYENRILGFSENMVAQNRATWCATGNNIRPSGDLPRRCYHIRLDAKSSRPYQGRKFRHENLLEWIGEHRAELLRALLIIARAWFAQGKPKHVEEPLGSFEDWHRTIGGILACAQVEGFLANLHSWITEADEMAVQWENLLTELRDTYGEGWFTVSQIITSIRSSSDTSLTSFTLPDTLGDVDRRKQGSLERALGRSFTKRIGMRFGKSGLRLERKMDGHGHVYRWRVVEG